MERTIWLDMDGTIANLYAVPDWLPKLRAYDPSPYELAAPLVNMAALARILNNRQKKGYKIGIISALSKEPTPEYDEAVKTAKLSWLRKHLPSVQFDFIRFVPYTTCKNDVNTGNDILCDDEARHLEAWTGMTINAISLLPSLRALA